jgi:hypothetical protein
LNQSSAEASQGLKSVEMKREEEGKAKAATAAAQNKSLESGPRLSESFTVILKDKDTGQDVQVRFHVPLDFKTGPKAPSAQLKKILIIGSGKWKIRPSRRGGRSII